MKQDIVLAGVGGQGILSIAFVIDNAALKKGLKIKQAEVHGMAQRGGAVQSHLRLSEEEIHSDLIPKGEVDMILSVEPLETLRYLDYLGPGGYVVTSSTPMVNIPDYPDVDEVLSSIRRVERAIVVDSGELAREAGSGRAQNMVMLGAASPHLILDEADILEFIEVLFRDRGGRIVEINRRAFRLGREAAGSR
jgi:indolepyruvate ferredoxin oxidoreductase beta subunit